MSGAVLGTEKEKAMPLPFLYFTVLAEKNTHVLAAEHVNRLG